MHSSKILRPFTCPQFFQVAGIGIYPVRPHQVLTNTRLTTAQLLEHVADFSITMLNGETTIKVSHPGAAEPFFHAKTKPVSFLSKIPIPMNSSILGDFFRLIQPSLSAGSTAENAEDSKWATVSPSLKGNSYVERLIPQLDGKVGDGKGFPAIVPWSVGLYTPNMKGIFGLATFANLE